MMDNGGAGDAEPTTRPSRARMLGLLPMLAAGVAASVLRAAHSEGAVGDGWFLAGLGIAAVVLVSSFRSV